MPDTVLNVLIFTPGLWRVKGPAFALALTLDIQPEEQGMMNTRMFQAIFLSLILTVPQVAFSVCAPDAEFCGNDAVSSNDDDDSPKVIIPLVLIVAVSVWYLDSKKAHNDSSADFGENQKSLVNHLQFTASPAEEHEDDGMLLTISYTF